MNKTITLPYGRHLKDRARALRKGMTEPEKKLWYQFLRDIPVMVHRQKIIQHYIVDFYIASKKLIIEIDGDTHYTEQSEQYDAMRTKQFEKIGLRVIRFTNREVRGEFTGVCDTILRELK